MMKSSGVKVLMGVFAAGAALMGCDDGESTIDEAQLRQELIELAEVDMDSVDQNGLDDSLSLFSEPGQVEATGFEPCEIVISRRHRLRSSDGARLELLEKFSPASVFRFPRRSVLMLTGTLVTADQYAMDVDGTGDFDALDRAARAGYFAFALTYEGYPGSSTPPDGQSVGAEKLLGQAGEAVEWIRKRRHVPQVDLLGSSLGSSLAVALGGLGSPIDRHHVGRLILTALVYKEVRPEFAEAFFSPAVLDLFLNAPNGYVQTIPDFYGAVLALAEPAAAATALEQWPGIYAVGPTLEGFDLPVFEAELGRAPALQIYGDADPISPWSDVTAFQSEYGGEAEVEVVPGGGHAVYLEPGREQQWAATFDFLDEGRPGWFLACAR